MTEGPSKSKTPRPWLSLRFGNLDPDSAEAQRLVAALTAELEPAEVPVSSGRMVALSADLPTWVELALAGLAAEALWRLSADARRRIASAVFGFLKTQEGHAGFRGVAVKVYVDGDEHQVVRFFVERVLRDISEGHGAWRNVDPEVTAMAERLQRRIEAGEPVRGIVVEATNIYDAARISIETRPWPAEPETGAGSYGRRSWKGVLRELGLRELPPLE